MSLDDQIHRLIDCNCPLAGCSGNCKHRWIDISICGTGQVQYAVAGTLFNHFYDMHKGSTPGLYKSTDYGVTWTQPTGPHSGPQARPAPACQRSARRRSPPSLSTPSWMQALTTWLTTASSRPTVGGRVRRLAQHL